MHLASKGRYAVTAMMDLAIHDREGPVTLADMAKKQGVSVSYLEQLFSKLRVAGLVEGVRGPGGGYRLAKAPARITVAEIVTCVDEAPGRTNRETSEQCKTHELWKSFSHSVFEFLDGLTLESFVDRREVRAFSRRQNADRTRLNFILPRPAVR